jgi:LPXTG-motif cell wall-anchored protein
VTLPDTGLDAWGVAAVGIALVFVIFGARRLRRAE